MRRGRFSAALFAQPAALPVQERWQSIALGIGRRRRCCQVCLHSTSSPMMDRDCARSLTWANVVACKWLHCVCVCCARHTSDATQRISIRPDTIWLRALASPACSPRRKCVRETTHLLSRARLQLRAGRAASSDVEPTGLAGSGPLARPPARSPLIRAASALGGHRRTNQAFACEMLRHLAARACAQVHLASSSGAQVHAKAPGALRGAGGLVSV